MNQTAAETILPKNLDICDMYNQKNTPVEAGRFWNPVSMIQTPLNTSSDQTSRMGRSTSALAEPRNAFVKFASAVLIVSMAVRQP